MDISTILSQIDLGSYALPEFQRGYVWNRDQVRKLMSSLYHDYPIGSLLVWVTNTNSELARGNQQLTPGSVNLILDGQQRITTLYGIIRGHAPQFFDGNARTFTGLYFDLDTETFEFYAIQKMKDRQNWVNVTEVMQLDAGNYITKAMSENPQYANYLIAHIDKLNRLSNIKKIDLYVQQVVGEDKTIDVVVDIFNSVNSGGTKLSKGDLALAKICAEWPDARDSMKEVLEGFRKAGYKFEMDWFLRCMTVNLTGKAYFDELINVPIEDIKKSIGLTKGIIGTILDHIGSRLGLDHNRVIGSRYALVAMLGYLRKKGGKLQGSAEWDKLLYWYVNSFLWGRYAGSIETTLSLDLNIIDAEGSVDALIRELRQNRGDLRIHPDDFRGWGQGARFYPLLYLLTRTCKARDFASGIELSKTLLGNNSSLEVHHIFPKDVLYRAGYTKPVVNSLGNYAFLTKDTNLEVSNQQPSKYIPYYENMNPGVMESNWISMDPELWQVDHYRAFLDRRKELLAEAANTFLDSLLNGRLGAMEVENYSDRNIAEPNDSEAMQISDMIEWMHGNGLDEGIENLDIMNQDGDIIATIDLAWPNGVQNNLSEPLALLIDETEETREIVNQHGYKYFTDPVEMKKFIKMHYLE